MWKEGDIYRWSWTDEVIKKRQDSLNAGALYWCMSRIGIVKKVAHASLILVDTYWSGGASSKWFSWGQCNEDIEITFVANMNDLRKAEEYEQAMYLDEDCVNLNHANRSRGNFYIKKDAKKSVKKMKRLYLRAAKGLENDIQYKLNQIEWYRENAGKVTEDSYVSLNSEVPLSDNYYLDEE